MSIPTTAVTLSVFIKNIKDKKKKLCLQRFFQYCVFIACAVSLLLQAHRRFPLIFVPFMFQRFGRLAHEVGFGAGIPSEKHWGPRARQGLGIQVQINSWIQFRSILYFFLTKTQILQELLFLEGPLIKSSTHK